LLEASRHKINRVKAFPRFFRQFEAFSLFGSAEIGASATLMEEAERGRGGEKRKRLARKHHDFEKRPYDTFAN